MIGSSVFLTFFSQLAVVVFCIGLTTIVIGALAEHIAIGHELPAMAITFLLLLALAIHAGYLKAPVIHQVARQDLEAPYCEGWLYYVDARCWFAN